MNSTTSSLTSSETKSLDVEVKITAKKKIPLKSANPITTESFINIHIGNSNCVTHPTSTIVINFDNFKDVNETDQKKINDLFLNLKKFYTPYILNVRSKTNARKLAIELFKNNNYEISCLGMKFLSHITISSVSKTTLLSTSRKIFTESSDYDAFDNLFNRKNKHHESFCKYLYPKELYIIDEDQSQKYITIPKSNNIHDVFVAHIQTALKTQDISCHYRRIRNDIALLLKSYAKETMQTIRVILDNKSWITARMETRYVSSLSSKSIENLLTTFCEENKHFQVNHLVNKFFNELINSRAAKERVSITTSICHTNEKDQKIDIFNEEYDE